MISGMTIIFMMITLILSTVVPVLILIMLRIRLGKGVYVPWIAGALGFFVPQVIIRIPVLQLLSSLRGFPDFVSENTYLYFGFLAGTAALFETTGRLIVFRVALRKRLSYTTGIAAGAGHGAVESIMIVGLTYINNLIYSFLINSNMLSLIIKDENVSDDLIRAITGTSNELFLMAGFERIFTMAFHLILSVLLVLFIMKGRTVIGTLLVLALHAGMDFLVVAMQYQGYSPWLIEGLLLFAAIASLAAVILLKNTFGASEAFPEDPAEAAVKEGY